MRPKIRQLLEESIENGIWHGFEKAHKHTDHPADSQIIEEIEHYIWLYIDERFDFEPETVTPSPRDLVTEILEGFDRLEANRNKCKDHPDAPHGMDRGATHNAGRYVCECESWKPDNA